MLDLGGEIIIKGVSFQTQRPLLSLLKHDDAPYTIKGTICT